MDINTIVFFFFSNFTRKKNISEKVSLFEKEPGLVEVLDALVLGAEPERTK